jgi:hypothetical protein
MDDVAEIVENMARWIFEECGDPEDYCVQSASWDCIIFGGWNRVKLTSKGWTLIEHNCRPEFIAKFKEKF